MMSVTRGNMKQAGRTKQHVNQAAKEETKKASSSTALSATTHKKKLSTARVAPPAAASTPATGAHKLTRQQVAELLKVFWVELLQNNVRQVRKMLVANLHSINFRAAKYAPAADGSALHLCAQHGFLAMARLLVDMKVVDLNAQNKVGSTPLHVACKFGQDAMLLFLLELGVRVDVPDSVGLHCLSASGDGNLSSNVLVAGSKTGLRSMWRRLWLWTAASWTLCASYNVWRRKKTTSFVNSTGLRVQQ